jgi:hypothetical protein
VVVDELLPSIEYEGQKSLMGLAWEDSPFLSSSSLASSVWPKLWVWKVSAKVYYMEITSDTRWALGLSFMMKRRHLSLILR